MKWYNMDKKKILLPILMVIILILVLFTGCINLNDFPVKTISPSVNYDFNNVQLKGYIAFPFCKSKNYKFVYDTESHENWEEYKHNVSATAGPYGGRFVEVMQFSEFEHKVTYYIRGVAYCYDFRRPFKHYEEGYYAGSNVKLFIDS